MHLLNYLQVSQGVEKGRRWSVCWAMCLEGAEGFFRFGKKLPALEDVKVGNLFQRYPEKSG